MKTLIKTAIVALSLAGASLAIPTTAANAAVGFYVGPGGVQVEYGRGSYYDRHHVRHYYNYPRDYATYRHSRSWYRTHPRWYQERDWYRR